MIEKTLFKIGNHEIFEDTHESHYEFYGMKFTKFIAVILDGNKLKIKCGNVTLSNGEHHNEVWLMFNNFHIPQTLEVDPSKKIIDCFTDCLNDGMSYDDNGVLFTIMIGDDDD